MENFRPLKTLILSLCLMLPTGLSSKDRTAPDDPGERARWLAANGVPLRSGDADDTDFADLMPIREMVGNARVVLLGEQSHGDGTTFLMKCRLVRFFHEVMGFNVLAWESGLYDCREMEAALHQDLPIQEAIARGVFSIWGVSRQVRPVFEYARSTHGDTNPLEMSGFDCQFSAPASAESFPNRLLRFLKGVGPSVLSVAETKLLSTAFNSQAVMKMTPEERLPYKAFVGRLPGLLEQNRAALESSWSTREISYWNRILRNLGSLYEMLETISAGKLTKASDNNSRDRAMGETLVWLANEYYRGRKIIVWAASFHTMRRGSEIETRVPGLDYATLRTMGDEVFEKLKDEAYSITFTAYQGKMGVAHRPNTEAGDIPAAEEGSLESAFHETGQKFMFLDFRRARNDPEHWMRKGIVARPLGYGPMKADWARHFDAIVFTDTMEPSTRVESEAPRPPLAK
jgi:erythromycin esterase